MRRWLQVGVVFTMTLVMTGYGLAQEAPKPDQLKKMYDAALTQLKQAQDRKNELAAENDKLNAKLVELQKQVDADKVREVEANREAAEFAEKTFFLRSHYAAWHEFISQYPKLEQAWKMYLSGDALSPPQVREYIDKDWPLSPE